MSTDAVADLPTNSLSQSQTLLCSLYLRGKALLNELDAFQTYLKGRRKQHAFDAALFRRNVQAELKSLDKIASGSAFKPGLGDAASNIPQRVHSLLVCSNIPFHEIVWSTARKRRGLVALSRRIYWQPNTTVQWCDIQRSSKSRADLLREKLLDCVTVDVVSANGAEWIKTSTVTNKRLLFELAKEGWESYADCRESGECLNEDDIISTDEASMHRNAADEPRPGNELDIVMLAKRFRAASLTCRVNFQHPKVIFFYPKVEEGKDADVDAIIRDIRKQQVEFWCQNSSDYNINFVIPRPDDPGFTKDYVVTSPCSQHDFTALVRDNDYSELTQTVNIDCSTLIALISDISHTTPDNLPPTPRHWSLPYRDAILRQIASEKDRALLPNTLYSVLESKRLVCTNAAACRTATIVTTMATDSEVERAEILLGTGPFSESTKQELQQALQARSQHAVPMGLRLPIEIIEFDALKALVFSGGCHPDPSDFSAHENEHCIPGLPQLELEVAQRMQELVSLSEVNCASLLYGWSTGIVTITGSADVTAKVNKAINAVLDEMERSSGLEIHGFVGPRVHVCHRGRSLVGTEKTATNVVAYS